MRFFHCRPDSDCGQPQGRGGRILHFGGHILLGIVVIIAVSVVVGWLVMTCWNAVIPAVFGLPALDFWQSVALLVLARLLTGRLHHHRPRKGRKGWRKGRCCPGAAEPPAASPDAPWLRGLSEPQPAAEPPAA